MFYSISSADQDSALASRKETLLSEQGCLCQALKRCPASAFTREHINLCSCPRASRARRQRVRWLGDAGEAGGSRASPPPAPPSLAEMHSSTQPTLPAPREPGVLFDIIISINTKRRQGTQEILATRNSELSTSGLSRLLWPLDRARQLLKLHYSCSQNWEPLSTFL